MYSVRPRISGNYSNNYHLNATIDSIDTKVALMATCLVNHIQYDLSCNADLDLYDDLVTYRRILLEKLLGCNCVSDQKLIKIISRIKKLAR